MAEENQSQQEPQQVKQEPQQVQRVMQEPQRVTTKDPKKVEAGRGWLQSIIRREKNKRNWRRLE